MTVDRRDRQPERPRRVLLPALGVLALLVVVALAAGTSPLGIGGRGTGPGTSFFDYAWTTFVIVVVLWIAASLWYAWQLRGRSHARPASARRWWVSVLFYAAFIVAAALLLRATPFHSLRRPQASQTPPAQQPGGAHRAREAAHAHTAAFRWQELAVVLGLLALLGLAAVIRRRRGGALRRLSLRPHAALALSAAFDDAVDDLRAEPDVRRAIVAAYARTEQVLALHGLPRRRSEAPLEYLERTLGTLEASAPSIARLTELFEWARFSPHEPGPGTKDEAIDALLAVRDELRAPDRRAAA